MVVVVGSVDGRFSGGATVVVAVGSAGCSLTGGLVGVLFGFE